MEFWHVLNRGVDKRSIVTDDADRLRFIHDLYVFNDEDATPNFILGARHEESKKRKLLVDIHAFCLMGNHYHLLLTPRIENGIPKFMKKLNMGYAKYFNERHKRTGALWQGKYKKIRVERDAHFLYVPFYIHLNPLDFEFPEWREGEVKRVSDAFAYLESYRWSSYPDYVGKRNFPSITRRDSLKEFIGAKNYRSEIRSIITCEELAEQSKWYE